MGDAGRKWRVTRRQVLQAAGGATAVWKLPRRSAAQQIDGGTVYIGTGDSGDQAIPVNNGMLYAVDAATGEQVWTFAKPSTGVGSPIVVNGTVYIGCFSGVLYAVDAATGTEQWTFEAGDELPVPTVVNGTVYVGSRVGNALHAVDANSGEQDWKQTFSISEYTNAEGVSTPIVVDNIIYTMVGRYGSALHAINADSGEQEWTFTQLSGNGNISSPTVVDGTVYAGSGSHLSDDNAALYAISANSGEQEWTFTQSGVMSLSPTVAKGTVYTAAGGHSNGDATLHAVDADSGEQEWSTQLPSGIPSSPTVADGTVFVGSTPNDDARDPILHAVDASSGEQQWTSTQPFNNSIGVPTVVGDTIYIADRDLHAVDVATGAEKWRFAPSSGWASYASTIVEDPEGGNSVGSLVTLGTLGHHGDWRYAGQNIDVITENTGTTGSDDPSGGVALGTIEMVAGGGSLAGLLGVYALMRRSSNKDTQTGRSPTDSNEPVDPDSDLESSNSSKPSNVGSRNTIDDPLLGDGLEHSGAEIKSKRPLDSSDSVSTNSADSTQERSTSGPPETISSPHSRSLNYAEIKKRDRIGTGGNADVYAAQLSDGQQVALKEPRMEGTVDIKTVQRFVREAKTWDKLDDHDHIVGVVDYGADPVPWIGLEYMNGGDLSAVLANELSFAARKWIAVSICRAVRHAHRRGVAHLDLKPANVLFSSSGDSWPVPKISDWGLAKMLLNHSQSVEGFSPTYSAPEQFAAEEYGAVDDITDIYQVGTVCYELFTGEPPFGGSHAEVMRSVLDEQPAPPSSVAAVPSEADEVLLKALQKEKTDRYESIIQLRNQLQDLPDRL